MPFHTTENKNAGSYIVCNDDVAIIGMDCTLPDSEGTNRFWNNLKYGTDHLGEFSKQRGSDIEKYCEWNGEPIPKFRKGNYLNTVDNFDYRFFGIAPKEATLMNPNQRLILQTVYRTFQDAGLSEKNIKGSDTGLFIGYIGDYDGSLYTRMVSDTQVEPSPTGCLASMSVGRISYLLDLHGPAIMTDTACSSSLVAVYQAFFAIRSGECSMAVAAGVRTILKPDKNLSIGIESNDGVTRVFDKEADGTGIGEGVASVLLKPLSEALRDKDLIYAVIKGGSVNQDGSCIGLTAPNVNAQIDVLKTAWRNSGISPNDISYIEAHGTGTRLGDPIEVDGLKKAFRCFTDEKNFCAVGSVKSNFGHLYDCAGIVSVIKTALMLKNRTIVPTAHFKELNPEIDLSDSPIRIADCLEEWKSRNDKRIAGISAFGFSGTNCHIVLEEAKSFSVCSVDKEEETLLFAASAKSKDVLYRLLNEYRVLSYSIVDNELSSFCMSTQITRTHYRYRVAIPVNSVDDLREKLELICDYRILDETRSPFEGVYFGCADKEEAAELSKDINNLAEQYITYCDICFEKRYYHRNKQKIRLPLYPFDKERCWLDIPKRIRIYDNIVQKIADITTVQKPALTGRPDSNYSATEYYIADIFFNELGYNELSIDDDIYALGGDSITAYHIVNRINNDCGTALTMADILKYRNISRVAEFVEMSAASGKSKYHIQKARPRKWYPLSYAQQRMYFMYLRNPKSVSYNMPFTLHIKGALDIEQFEKAFRRITDIHDVFRTHFSIQDGEAAQYVAQDSKIEFGHIYGTADEKAIIQRRRPFDLGKDVLIRATLFHVKEGEEYIVYIDMNHISADGSSLGVLIGDLMKLYQGEVVEKNSIQYVDFAVWQRNSDMEQFQRFWLQELENAPHTELPLDHYRNNRSVGTCNIHSFYITSEEYSALNDLCINIKVGIFGLLFAAYQASLAAFMNADEVVTGTPISGRTTIETQCMVGMFVNVMPVRTKIDRDESFTEYVKKVHNKILEILDNQDYPFDLLVEKLNVKREGGRNPVYDTVFAFQNMDIPEITIDSLDIELSNEDNVSKFDITVEAMKHDGDLTLSFKYDSSLFEIETVTHFADILHGGFAKLIESPDSAVGELFADDSLEMDDSGFEHINFDF